MKIRTLQKSDIAILIDLEKKLLGETIGEAMLRSEMENKYAYFYVATTDQDQVIGYLGAWIIDQSGELINFVIAKEYQHQGYGTKLLNHLIKVCQEQEVSDLILEVKASNQIAINFYQQFGFKQIAIRKQYYHDQSDALILKKVLL